ncbi:MAG: acyl-CoA desaturase [Elusimicrobiota bacterium]
MSYIKNFLAKIDLINASFLVLTPIIAFTGTAYLAFTHSIQWETIVLAIFMAIATGVGITGGYHRLFSHRGYEARSLYKLFMLLFGAAAFENSALHWSSDHRKHHKYVDTNLDPYNIKRGFWFAHMGWVMLRYDGSHQYNNVSDLEEDKLVQWQNRHYVKIGIIVGFVFPTLLASIWGDPLGGFFIAGFLRTVMNHHFTFSINSFAHMIGKRPYSDQNTSRDSWFLALVTYGEGYHNYHHKFPTDYRNGIRAYHWDPTKWIIKTMEKFGQTYNLRQIPNETILRARLKMDEKRLVLALEKVPTLKIKKEFILSTRAKIEQTYVQFRYLKTEYKRLKQERMAALSHQVDAINERIEKLKIDIEISKKRLQESISEWGQMCSSYGVRGTQFAYV